MTLRAIIVAAAFATLAFLIIGNAKAQTFADANGNSTHIIGGRPAGCPFRYCGCGLRKFLNIADKRLDLAANWKRLFARAMPGPGRVAVWPRHVAYIERMGAGRMAFMRDYNSGRGLSRLHWRSIAGAVIVDPNTRL